MLLYSDKTDSISFILRKTEVSPREKNKNETSYLLPHAFMEDTIMHNIAQMTSSKAYITIKDLIGREQNKNILAKNGLPIQVESQE